jgi:transaldolase
MSWLPDLKVEIFADGADPAGILRLAKNQLIRGFTTNPSLMRQAGVADYQAFARALLDAIRNRPISFEVFADDLDGMIAQARTIAAWARNVNVKIPVTDTKGRFAGDALRTLSSERVPLNVTAVFTLDQVRAVADALNPDAPAIVSVFAGRIADTGVDPVRHMQKCKEILRSRPSARLLWASTRELLNIFQAEESGCDIITVPPDILDKLDLVGKDLGDYSRETVQMFHRDAQRSGYHIAEPAHA